MDLESFAFVPSDTATSLEKFHQAGEMKANHGNDPAAARELFADALELFEASPEDERTNLAYVTLARVLRDDGFAARKVHKQTGRMVADTITMRRLAESRETTAGVLGIPETANVQAFGVSVRTIKRLTRHNHDLAQVMAEHGATISGMARLLVQQTAQRNEIPSAEAINAIQATFWQAHGFLILGNNAYYRTSNAMNAARGELLAAGITPKLHALDWQLVRTPLSLGYGSVHNRENLLPSLKTTARLLGNTALISSHRAIQSAQRHL